MIKILRDTFSSLFSRLTILIALVASLGTALAGPFGTFTSMSLATRLVYWPLIVLASIVFGYLSFAIASMVVKQKNTTALAIVHWAVGTVLVTSAIWGLGTVFPGYEDFDTPISVIAFYVGFVFTCVVLARLTLLNIIQSAKAAVLTNQMPEETPEPGWELSEEAEETQSPWLVRRLPEDMQGEIWRITADNHFVEVATEMGSTSLRMRFRDAIAEMNGIDGSIVHRSHWVNHEAVKQAEKAQGKLFLRLVNGDVVPVSRSYRANLDETELGALLSAPSELSEVSGQ